MSDPDSLHPADRAAIARVLAVEPQWQGLATARDAVGLADRTLLHAGPPFPTPHDIVVPVVNAAAVAAVFEGWAADFEAAGRVIRAGEVRLMPAQDLHVVTPLAAVVSPSMALQQVVDRNDPARIAWSPFNEGNGPVTRVGLRGDDVLARMRWLNRELAEVMRRALAEPVALIPLADHGLAQGDDCHGRTPAATKALTAILAPRLGGDEAATRVGAFLYESPGFFLNLWMAASKCMMRAAERPGSSVVTAAAGNGRDVGIKLGGAPQRWVTAPAEPPRGPLADPALAVDFLGAIGDSAVVDSLGLGAMALGFAPETAAALKGFLPDDAMALPQRILAALHPQLGGGRLRIGLAARSVVATGAAPIISLGVVDKTGRRGRLTGGVYRPPASLFARACEALEETS